MLCFRYRRLLIPYSEGELGSNAARNVERHLVKCARCRTELDGIRMISGALSASDQPGADPADDLWARVSARIAEGSPKPTPRSAFAATRGLAAGVTAAVVVAVVGIKLFTPTATTDVAQVNLYDKSAPKESHRIATKADPLKKVATANAKTEQPPKVAPPPPSRDKTETPKPPRVQSTRRWFAEKPDVREAGRPAKSEVVALAYRVSNSSKADAPAADNVYVDRADAVSPRSGGFALATTPSRPVATLAPAASPAVPASAESPEFDERAGWGLSYGAVASTARGVDSLPLYADATTTAAPTTSVVDDLNETEGVRTAAIFAYP